MTIGDIALDDINISMLDGSLILIDLLKSRKLEKRQYIPKYEIEFIKSEIYDQLQRYTGLNERLNKVLEEAKGDELIMLNVNIY